MRPRFDPGAMKMPWRKKWQPTPVLLPGDSHGQRSLAGYSPWGRRVRHDGVTQHKPTSGDGGGQGSLACSLWDRSQTGLSKRTTIFCSGVTQWGSWPLWDHPPCGPRLRRAPQRRSPCDLVTELHAHLYCFPGAAPFQTSN